MENEFLPPGGWSNEIMADFGFDDINHSKTKAKKPQNNGVYKRFHKRILDGFYKNAFRKKICLNVDELQQGLGECKM